MLAGETLPGYLKKSFSLPYNAGEIWFEHLDGIYDFEELVMRKLTDDMTQMVRPSAPGYVCFVFNETEVTDQIRNDVKNVLCLRGKRFLKVAFVGLDRENIRKFKKELSGCSFTVGFLGGLEAAKRWLLP